jgi:glycosyltransferase involved in cell wall biosynthesis
MVTKALVVGTYQRKAEELARLPGMELTVAVPPFWREGGHRIALERSYTAGYSLVTLPMALNGHYHTHFYRGLGALVARVRPQVMHLDEEHYNVATYQGMRLAVRGHIPALFFAWQNIARDYPPPFSLLERYNFRHAAHAIAGNKDAATIIRDKGYRGPIAVIPQFGVDPTLFAPDDRGDRARSPADPFVVGFVCGPGRLTPAKGLHVLLEALAGLEGAWELRVVGTGESRDDCEGLARRLGIAGRVTFLGVRPSAAMPEAMRAFDLLVGPSLTTPSWKEQFGRMLVEAMSCGVPVIGSDSGEIPNVIGDAGIVVPESDSKALRAAVARLRDHAGERASLAERGRARVLELFTQEAVARRTYAVYREMLDGAGGAAGPA